MIKLIKSTFIRERQTKEQLAQFIMDAPMLSMGAQCQQFEENFARKQGRRFTVFVSSGSSANLVLIQALLNLGRLKKGDPVGVSALTWATNIMPLLQLGLRPVPLDCELTTLNVSPRTVKEHLGSMKGLFLTNVLGFCDDIEAIQKLCEEHHVVFLEDNCESLGSKVNGKLLGNFSLASTFSFFVGHHISTIEGGMICTDDEELREMLLMVRAHGWDRNFPKDVQQRLRAQHNINPFFAKYTFYDLAYNVRPTEIQGLLGNAQLQFWDEIVQRRVENFNRFKKALEGNSDFLPFKLDHMELISNFAMPVVCKTKELFERYRRRFEERGVEIRPIIAGDMTRQPFYQKYVPSFGHCENASLIHSQGFYFGNNPELTEEEVSVLCNLLSP